MELCKSTNFSLYVRWHKNSEAMAKNKREDFDKIPPSQCKKTPFEVILCATFLLNLFLLIFTRSHTVCIFKSYGKMLMVAIPYCGDHL